MARINMDGPDRDLLLKRLFPYTGVTQAFTGSTKAVLLASIEAGDIVTAQLLTSSTVAAHVTYNTITSGTGFISTVSEATVGTIGWTVHKPNA